MPVPGCGLFPHTCYFPALRARSDQSAAAGGRGLLREGPPGAGRASLGGVHLLLLTFVEVNMLNFVSNRLYLFEMYVV